jgi:ubiquinone/menaquinone biosynthesis C-methylase UbiE
MSDGSADRLTRSARFLADAPERSYASKLEHFGRFIAPDLRRILADFDFSSCGIVLDLGCGTGSSTAVLAERLSDDARIVGLDLSKPHLLSARGAHDHALVQADMERLCIADRSIDFIWTCNTINHAAEPVQVLRSLRTCLSARGRIALAQSGLLPEMYFAWDAHLDDAVRTACHAYYRDRYQLSCESTAGIRGLIRMLDAAGYEDIVARTYAVERTQPLTQADRAYFQHAVFEGLWGEKIVPYLGAEDRRRLEVNCDPRSSGYCLNRPDFHHIQTLTVCAARVPRAI